MRLFIGFVVGLIVTYLLASTFVSMHVQGQLADMGMAMSFSDRLNHVTHDWLGLAQEGIFPVVVAVGLTIGFVVAGLISRKLGRMRTLGYTLAGAVAMFTIHATLNTVFGMHPIAATREWLGLILQGVAGGAGGWVFAQLSHGDDRSPVVLEGAA